MNNLILYIYISYISIYFIVSFWTLIYTDHMSSFNVVWSNSVKSLGAWVMYHHAGRTDVVQAAHRRTRKVSNGSLGRHDPENSRDRLRVAMLQEFRCPDCGNFFLCLGTETRVMWLWVSGSQLHTQFLPFDGHGDLYELDSGYVFNWFWLCLAVFQYLSIHRKERIQYI